MPVWAKGEHRLKASRWMAVAAAVVATVAVLGLAFAPWGVTELYELGGGRIFPPTFIATARPPGPAAGTVVNDRWRVQQIAPDTFAIGEPQDDPDNYEYLLIGARRALLIDAGSTSRDIHPVLAGLTHLPVTVIPTHLHCDHTKGLSHFTDVALVDLPETRARLRDGAIRLSHRQYLCWSRPPAFPVTEWVKPDGEIDLGGRRVQVLWTPGHTSSSVSISDPAARLLFTGDLIYTTSLFAFMPDSSLSTYAATTDRLLAQLPADTRIYGAHCCRNDGPPGAPWLTMGDLGDLKRAVADIRSGKARGRGLVLRRFPVNPRMTLVTTWPFGNR